MVLSSMLGKGRHPPFDRGQPLGTCFTGLCRCRTDYAELSGRRGYGSSANEVTATPVYLFCDFGGARW
jgi:hypothetical protein